MPDHPPLPDWNDLRDLLLMHEAGSLSAAARRAGVSQSTMSRRLAALEAGGFPLLLRGAGGGLEPTARGAALLQAARAMRQAHDALVPSPEGAAPPIRVAACEVTAGLFLADALSAWAARGGVAADLSVHEDLFALPPAGYDILVTPAESAPDGAAAVEIGQIDWGLYAAPDYLARCAPDPGAATLDGHRVIRASASLAEISAYRWLAGLGGQVAMLSSSPLAQRAACERGQGIALLPGALAAGLVAVGLPGPPPTPVWMLADARDASHPRIAAFLRWARSHFRRRRSSPPSP